MKSAMRKTMAVAALATVGAMTVPLAAAGQSTDFEWRGNVAVGQLLEIKGVNGGIRAEPSSGDEVVVLARKRGDRSDPGTVRIEVVESGGDVTVCAVYPTPEGADEPNECRPGSGGKMTTRDNDVKVEFRVRVPDGVRFSGRTVNGEVSAEGLGAEVRARTVNGSIRVSTSSFAEAHTVNGSIEAVLGRTDWEGALEFETVNGGITVELPEGLDAEVELETVNGDFEFDFPVTVRGRLSRRELRGTIGEGGRRLRMETVNGGIRLVRG